MAKEVHGVKSLVKNEVAYMQAVVALANTTMTVPMLKALETYDPSTYAAKIKTLTALAASPDLKKAQIAKMNLGKIKADQQRAFKRTLSSVKVDVRLFTASADPALRATMEKALSDNVGLISNLQKDYGSKAYDDFGKMLKESPEFDLAAQKAHITEFLGKNGTSGKMLKNRSKLITRDQNNKLVGRLNEESHKQAGGREYRWATAHDARVRDTHKHLNGKIYAWDTPPSEGHPGQPIQCRCVAKFIYREPKEAGKSTEDLKLKKPVTKKAMLPPVSKNPVAWESKANTMPNPIYAVDDLQFVAPQSTVASGDYVEVLVHPNRLKQQMKGTGAKLDGKGNADMRSDFTNWMAKNPDTPIKTSKITVSENGKVRFHDVRGRIQADILIRDKKARRVVMSVHKNDLAMAKKHLKVVELVDPKKAAVKKITMAAEKKAATAAKAAAKKAAIAEKKLAAKVAADKQAVVVAEQQVKAQRIMVQTIDISVDNVHNEMKSAMLELGEQIRIKKHTALFGEDLKRIEREIKEWKLYIDKRQESLNNLAASRAAAEKQLALAKRRLKSAKKRAGLDTQQLAIAKPKSYSTTWSEGSAKVNYNAPTKEERRAVLEYQGGANQMNQVGGTSKIQKYLRKEEFDEDWTIHSQSSKTFTRAEMRQEIRHMDMAIAKSELAEDTLLYRGVDDLAAVFDRPGLSFSDLKVGDTMRDKAFMSTSHNMSSAGGFKGFRGARFNLAAKKGDPAFGMNIVAKGNKFSREKEILLPRGMTYRITKLYPDSSQIDIVLVRNVKQYLTDNAGVTFYDNINMEGGEREKPFFNLNAGDDK